MTLHCTFSKAIILLIVTSHRSVTVAKPTPKCAAGFVHCNDGDVVGSSGETCFEKCNQIGLNACCTDDGNNACVGFTGAVCPDGSCSGESACEDANIDFVVNSCVGEGACKSAGGKGGNIQQIIDSCRGGDQNNCAFAAYNGGFIGKIKNSCRDGDRNCYFAAFKGGHIDEVIDSCRGGDLNCYYAASRGGRIGKIKNSCRDGDQNCYFAAYFGGHIDEVIGSCQCGDEACKEAASNGGTIDGIKNGCQSDSVCFGAGKGKGIVITPAIANCCNSGENCANIKALPSQCSASKAGKTSSQCFTSKAGKTAKIAKKDAIRPNDAFIRPNNAFIEDGSFSYDLFLDNGSFSFDFSADSFAVDSGDIDTYNDEIVSFKEESSFRKRDKSSFEDHEESYLQKREKSTFQKRTLLGAEN